MYLFSYSSFRLLTVVAFAAVALPVIHAEEAAEAKAKVTNLKGVVKFPENIDEVINVEGLKLTKAVAVLKGRVNLVGHIYPDNWTKMTVDERKTWYQVYKKSDAYVEHQKKMAAANAARFTVSTPIAADGSFSFSGLKPSWYELQVMIVNDQEKDEPTYEIARAHILKQFFIRRVDQDHDLGTMTFKLKNVLALGETAPDFTAVNYDGSDFKLSDYRGKYVLFDFWATWCAPCIAEIPNLVDADRTYGGERFEVIGLSVDDKIDEPRAFLKKRKLDYKQGYLSPDRYEKVANMYGITSIPSIWLIGPDGKIIAKNLHGDTLKKAVKKALTPAAEE